MNSKRVYSDRMCDKVRHVTYQEAHDHKRGLGYGELEIYRCSFCGNLHLGHRSKRHEYKRPRRYTWMLRV